MSTSLGSAIVQGGMQGLGAIANIFTQRTQHAHEKALNQKSIDAQMNMAEYQYGKDLEQWERANQYNAPTAQMSRLRDAGLNPAMIYGSGGAKTQAAISPKYQAPRPEYRYSSAVPDFTQVLGAFNDFRRSNAEIDLLKSQANIAKSEEYYRDSILGGKAMSAAAKGSMEQMKYGVQRFLSGNIPQGSGYEYLKNTRAMKTAEHQLQALDYKNQLMNKQLEWYIYNQLGSTVVGLGSKAIGSFSRLIKSGKAAKGIGKLKKYQPDSQYGNWKRLNTSTGEIW